MQDAAEQAKESRKRVGPGLNNCKSLVDIYGLPNEASAVPVSVSTEEGFRTIYGRYLSFCREKYPNSEPIVEKHGLALCKQSSFGKNTGGDCSLCDRTKVTNFFAYLSEQKAAQNDSIKPSNFSMRT